MNTKQRKAVYLVLFFSNALLVAASQQAMLAPEVAHAALYLSLLFASVLKAFTDDSAPAPAQMSGIRCAACGNDVQQ